MSKINIRESLNRLDIKTDNKYDLRNTYDCSKISDDKKKELAEALNKNASAKTISRILDENSSIKIFPRDSEEYEKLDRVATFLTAMSPNKYYYYVGKTYFDYGQDWKWTTILAQKNDNGSYGDSYQALNPREQEEIILANSDEELEEIARNILRDAHVDKGFSESLTETINAKDSMVAQEFNYTMQYGDQSSDVNAAVIIIPGGLMINGEPADLTVYAEDENGEVINFKSVEEANDWINKYKDDVEFHVEQGNELHATPSAYYNSFDESLTEAIKDVNSLHSKIWNMDNNEKICFPNGYCVKCEFYDREGKAKRYIVTNKKDNVIIRGEFGFAWQPQIKKFEKDFFNLLNGRSIDESLKEAKIIEPKYRDGDVVFVGDASGYHGTFLIKGDFRNIPEELYHNIRQITKYGNLDKPYYKVEYRIDSDHLFEEDYRKFFEYITPILEDAGIDILKSEKDISNESLTEAKKVGSNKISQGMNLPGKNFEFVKVIDGIVSSKDRYECRIYSRELDSNYKTYGFYQGEVIFSEDYDPQLIDSVFPDEGTKVKLAIYRVPEDDPDHDWTGDYFVDYIDETNESLSEDYEDDVDNWQYLDIDQDYKKKKDYFGDIETVDEQLYKIVCKSGASEWPFESALSYEDAQEIVEYYGGRWIDERGFEWSMEIEEDDESAERVYPFDESLNEDASKPDFVVGFYAGQVDDETLELINPEKLVEVNVSADELKERYGKEAEKLLNDYTVQTADRLKNSSGMLQQMILQTAEQKAIYAHRLFSKFDEVKDRLGSNTYMDRKIEEINYPFRDGIKDLSKKLGKMLLPKRENLEEQINLPGYAVRYITGYAGNGVNNSETEWFRTEEERDRRVKELEDKNYIEIKTWKMDNFYHTLPKEESLNEGIEDLDSISSTKAKDMTDEDFKVLKPLVDEYLKDRKALGTWPDSVDERNFVKKWYKLADKCKEIAKNGMQGITGYGRLNDFIKIKILELARSVDNTFPWYVRNQLEKFGELDESLKEDIEDEEDFEYDDSDEVEEGVYFFSDGENYAWVERIAGPVHLDFDNWAVWSAREIVPIQDFIIRKNEQGGYDVDKDAYIAAINSKSIVYFVVDEDTGFIDWGPVENQTEAQDFLNGKISDWEEETGFRHPMHNDFFDESLKESRAIKNDDDFEITLHYDDIGNGKEYDYKLGYDEVVAYLKEIAWSNGDGPEDASEDEYLEWVMDNFDELSKKYELNVLDYFEDEASQYEYDHRNDEP